MLFCAGEQQAARECAEIHFSQFYEVTAALELVFLNPFSLPLEGNMHLQNAIHLKYFKYLLQDEVKCNHRLKKENFR